MRKIRLIENWFQSVAIVLFNASFRVCLKYSMTHRCGSQMILAEWVLTQLCDSLWQVARMIARWVVVKRKNDGHFWKKAFQCAKTRFCIAPPNPIVTIHLGLPGYRWNLLPIVWGGTKRRPNELWGYRDKCDSTFLGARRCLQKIINGSYRQLNQLPQEVS